MNEIRNVIIILNPNSINSSYENNSSPICMFFIHVPYIKFLANHKRWDGNEINPMVKNER